LTTHHGPGLAGWFGGHEAWASTWRCWEGEPAWDDRGVDGWHAAWGRARGGMAAAGAWYGGDDDCAGGWGWGGGWKLAPSAPGWGEAGGLHGEGWAWVEAAGAAARPSAQDGPGTGGQGCDDVLRDRSAPGPGPVVLLTFSRCPAEFREAFLFRPEFAIRRDALQARGFPVELGGGAKILVPPEHYEPLLDAIQLGGQDTHNFKPWHVFTDRPFENELVSVMESVSRQLSKGNKFYVENVRAVPLRAAAGPPGPTGVTAAAKPCPARPQWPDPAAAGAPRCTARVCLQGARAAVLRVEFVL
jgi:hypothetical protein